MNKHLETIMKGLAKDHSECMGDAWEAPHSYQKGFEAGAAEVLKQAQVLVDRLDNCEDVLRIIYLTTDAKTSEKARVCANKVKEALAEWKENSGEETK